MSKSLLNKSIAKLLVGQTVLSYEDGLKKSLDVLLITNMDDGQDSYFNGKIKYIHYNTYNILLNTYSELFFLSTEVELLLKSKTCKIDDCWIIEIL